jgi:YbbR domain-containing protein
LNLLYRIFFHNLALKLVALFAALILWLHVTTEKIYTVTETIEIRYLNPPKNIAILNPLPDKATAVIRGKGKSLLLLKFSKLAVNVNLARLRPGIRTIRIPKDVPFPEERDIKLLELEPESLVVSVDRITSRTVRVKVVTEGEPKEGFAFLKAAVLSNRVRLKGPSQLIGDYPEVETEPIPLKGKDTTFLTVAKLLPPISMTSLSPESVKVKIYLEASQVKEIKNLRVRVSGVSPAKVKLKPERITVKVLGPKSKMKNLKGRMIKVRINAEGLEPGTHKLIPTISVPSWARVVEISPSKVEVTLSE